MIAELKIRYQTLTLGNVEIPRRSFLRQLSRGRCAVAGFSFAVWPQAAEGGPYNDPNLKLPSYSQSALQSRYLRESRKRGNFFPLSHPQLCQTRGKFPVHTLRPA